MIDAKVENTAGRLEAETAVVRCQGLVLLFRHADGGPAERVPGRVVNRSADSRDALCALELAQLYAGLTADP